MCSRPKKSKESSHNLPISASKKVDSKSKLKNKGTKENPSDKSTKSSKATSAKSTPKSSHKSSKVTIQPSAVEVGDGSALNITTSLPSIPSRPAKYKPILYTFRIPSNTIPVTNGLVKCPPFYIQLDHTLAVVWSLFSKETLDKPLGVAQLQWGLNFLRGIHNKKGEHPKDVAVCIDAIEEALIRQYAEMADTVKPPGCKRCNCFGQDIKSEMKLSGSSNSIKRSNSEFQGRFKQQKPQLVTQRLPFSVNYAEMSRQNPNHLEQIFSANEGVPMAGSSMRREHKSLKKVASSSGNSEIALGTSYSRENMVEFLKAWRKEQIGKIQQELKRLHSIETFIGNVDKDNFQPYLDNQQLDVLVAQKIKTGKGVRSVGSASFTSTNKKHKSARTK